MCGGVAKCKRRCVRAASRQFEMSEVGDGRELRQYERMRVRRAALPLRGRLLLVAGGDGSLTKRQHRGNLCQ